MRNRRSSEYTLTIKVSSDIPGYEGRALDRLAEDCDKVSLRTGAGSGTNGIFVRFRALDDEDARDIVAALTHVGIKNRQPKYGEAPISLSTGLAAHKRSVTL